MVTFPQDAHFLCRKCKGSFLIPVGQFEAARRASDIVCPGCGAGTKASRAKIDAFFRFYQRFVAALDQLEEAGFPLSGYGINKHEMVPRYNLLSFTFACAGCRREHRVPMREARDLVNHPKLFFCHHCRHRPKSPSVVKEFFVAALNLDAAAVRFGTLQWNMFSPHGFETAWVEL